MNVAEVKQITREWVEVHGQHLAGFRAAHFMGSINRLPDDAPFPTQSSDVDMSIIHDGATAEHPVDLEYKGLMLEYGLRNKDFYESAEKILATPGIATDFMGDCIIADPDNILRRIQPQVQREYKHRKWVRARLDHEKQVIQQNIDHLLAVKNPMDALIPVLYITAYIAGTVVMADIKAPTHRKCLIRQKEVLAIHNRLDLHEEILAFIGCATFTGDHTMNALDQAIAAFDYAVAVKKTPSPFDFKLHPHLRSYFYEGSLEMIQAGYQREAVPWIILFHMIAMGAIQNDGDDTAKQMHFAHFAQTLALLDLTQLDAIQRRIKQASILANNIYQVAEGIMTSHPDIID